MTSRGLREWYPASALRGLPGLPGSARGVHLRATRERWPSRPRQGRGGGREYHISALPWIALAAIARRELGADLPELDERACLVLAWLRPPVREVVRDEVAALAATRNGKDRGLA